MQESDIEAPERRESDPQAEPTLDHAQELNAIDPRLGKWLQPSLDIRMPKRDIGAALVLSRVSNVVPDEVDEWVRAQGLGKCSSPAWSEDPDELLSSADRLEMVEDRLAHRDVEAPVLEREGLAGRQDE